MISTATGRTIYVDADANGLNDGSSWADAYNYLQDALTAASSGDEIRVAQGIYKPDQGVGINSGDRMATFQLKNGVVIKGGYAGFGEPDPNARDIELYDTILSGDLDGNDIDVNDPADLLDEPTRAENSYHVVTGGGFQAATVLDSFTVTAGNGNGGGGIYDRGGGVYNHEGSPTLRNCAIRGNAAFYGGGGIYNLYSSACLVDCTLTGNYVRGMGGGVMNVVSTTTLTHCAISGNATGNVGGGMFNLRGHVTLMNCIVSQNSAGSRGGGLDNMHGNASINKCIIRENSAHTGGAVCNIGSNSTFMNCTIMGNLARYGGGIRNAGSELTLTNCIIGRNSAYKGGGIYNHSDNAVTLTTCTFAANSASHGEAMACDSHYLEEASNIQVSNSILWDGGNEIWNNDNSVITITYSDVQGGWPGEGNIDADPLFVEPGYWDANGTPDDANDDLWVDGNYHLLVDSPCIDMGDPNYPYDPNETDLDGKPRVIGGRIDMGAYEYSPPIPAEARIVPRTLNLSSEGKWITVILWLGEDYNVGDIEPNSVFLEDEIGADKVSLEGEVMIVKFSRSAVQEILNAGEVELTVSGELSDGTRFEGTDTIRVIDKGGKNIEY